MKETVKRYLIPSKKNNFKPHLMRKTGLCIVGGLAVILFAAGIFETILFQKTDFLSSVLPPVLVDLANNDRSQSDLAMLAVNPTLTKVAQDKANDMAAKSYFSHTSPDGHSPWYWFSKDGYSYSSAGENLAINFTDSGDVNTAWMNSPEHRANILNGKFTEIGIATAEGVYQGHQTVFVVQEFGKPYIVKSGAAFVKTNTTSSLAAKPASSTVATASTTTPAPTASTTVLGATSNDPEVLSETQTFISVDSPQIADNTPAVSNTPKQASTLDKLATEPHKVIALGYMVLLAIIILGIALLVGIEIKHQHPKNVFAGLVVLFLIVLLFVIYQQMTGSVIVL